MKVTVDEVTIDFGAEAALVDGEWSRLIRISRHETIWPTLGALWWCVDLGDRTVWTESLKIATRDELSLMWEAAAVAL